MMKPEERPQDIKQLAYQSLVRSGLEYCWTVWDPYTTTNKYKLEVVQCCSVCNILNRYHNKLSMGDTLETLG